MSKLTEPEVAALVAAHEAYCWALARRRARGLDRADIEDAAAEARMQMLKSAREYNPELGVPFAAYVAPLAAARAAASRTKARLRGLCGVQAAEAAARAVRVQFLDTPFPDGTAREDPPDTRRPSGANPALALWCSDELRILRRRLTWFERLVVYLLTVEGWTESEIVDELRVSRESVRTARERAVWHARKGR